MTIIQVIRNGYLLNGTYNVFFSIIHSVETESKLNN